MSKETSGGGGHKIDMGLMIPAIVVTLLISVPLVIFQEEGAVFVQAMFSFLTGNFKWMFLLYGFFCVAFLIWLAMSRWGNIKLGGPDDEPEFSTYKWATMIFCAGIGIGIARWAFVEPAYYISAPPLGILPNTVQAAEWAGMLGQFHWGITPWAIYALPAFPIAYAIHVKKVKTLRLSTACRPVLGDKVDGLLGKAIDVLVIFGMIGAVGTSLGLAVPLVSALVSYFLAVENGVILQMLVLLAFVLLVCVTVFCGLKKGIAKLYDIKIYISYFLILYLLIVGPAIFILNTWVNSLGLLVTNFIRMSLFTDPVGGTGFPESWTVFYWAWWTGYSPMMGIFVAKISKGRTIRQLVITELTAGALGCWVFFAVFGGYSINLQINNILNITELAKTMSADTVILTILNTLPLSRWLVIPVFAVLCLVFLSAIISSSAYSLAAQVHPELSGDEEPSNYISTLWAVLLGVYAAGLLATGGLTSVQLSSVMLSFPLMIIMVILTISFMRWLQEDYGAIVNPKPLAIKPEDVKPVE